MNLHARTRFKLVAPPFVGRAIDVPPILNASDRTDLSVALARRS
jgi:hypothetical protein